MRSEVNVAEQFFYMLHGNHNVAHTRDHLTVNFDKLTRKRVCDDLVASVETHVETCVL